MISHLESPGEARCIEQQVARPGFKIADFLVILMLLSRRPVALKNTRQLPTLKLLEFSLKLFSRLAEANLQCRSTAIEI